MSEFENYMYDDWSDWDEAPNPKSEEMQDKGFDHVTNFSPDREFIYRKAAKIHGLKISIEDECYSMQGNKISGLKAFYVDATIGDLSDFWRTFEKLRGEGIA